MKPVIHRCKVAECRAHKGGACLAGIANHETCEQWPSLAERKLALARARVAALRARVQERSPGLPEVGAFHRVRSSDSMSSIAGAVLGTPTVGAVFGSLWGRSLCSPLGFPRVGLAAVLMLAVATIAPPRRLRRVAHLARHARKRRVRKKNARRLDREWSLGRLAVEASQAASTLLLGDAAARGGVG